MQQLVLDKQLEKPLDVLGLFIVKMKAWKEHLVQFKKRSTGEQLMNQTNKKLIKNRARVSRTLLSAQFYYCFQHS